MILFPNCKINLGLNILQKRSDGFHDLETGFFPVRLFDILEILPSTRFTFHHSGIPIPGRQETNLCIRAWNLIKKDYPFLPELEIWLHKHIPMGSGLGGGSSDATHMLKMINEVCSLDLSAIQLSSYALQLGSDCPFFLSNQPCLARGRGELLEPLTLDLANYVFLLIHGGIHIDTSWAFSRVSINRPSVGLKEILLGPVSSWKSHLVNDFEAPVMEEYPVLRKIKEKLYQAGALYASMTGSGSSFYGIFRKGVTPSISFEENFSTLLIS
jgi:4-diphosphocytidyl-2-C-methyl-D-erythritol kinase